MVAVEMVRDPAACSCQQLKSYPQLVIMIPFLAHSYISQEPEAGKREFQAKLAYIMRSCSKTKTTSVQGRWERKGGKVSEGKDMEGRKKK